MTVIEAGTVHPVAGPVIKDGIIVIRGDRILAIGQQGELQFPENTTVYKYPTGHVYPGLIDASTDAFTDAPLRSDSSLNGGSKISEGLVWTDSRDDHLVEHGITTAYVYVRSGAQLRGQGSIVRPRKNGFDLWEDREQAAVQLRMTAVQSQPGPRQGPDLVQVRGPRGNVPVIVTRNRSSSHALQRQSQLEAAAKIFDGVDAFREAQEKFEEALEKYETDFEKYIEYHNKKNGKDKKGDEKDKAAEKPKAEKSSTEEPTLGPGDGRRRGGRRGEGRPPRREPPKEPPGGGGLPEMTQEAFEEAMATLLVLAGQSQNSTAAQDPKPQGRPSGAPASRGSSNATPTGQKPGSAKTPAKKDDGPKRPTYPKKPAKNPQMDALVKVVDGDLPLRIEAHRVDELRAALRLQRTQEIPLVVLEQAYAADRVTSEMAEQSVTVVLTDLLPNSLGIPGDKQNPYSKFDPTALPLALNQAGIPFAIASGSARLSSLLPLMAASAVGRGLPEEAALRAITLTPAEILGVAKDTGSLTRGKFADVIVTDGPLLATDSRVLLVVAKGRTEYEAK